MKRIVFISHSSADRAIAERACAYLEQNGVACWMAPRDVMPGKNYGAAIVDAIDECRVFVLILSSHSNKSRQVVREVERAASSDSVILPFRIEDVQPSRDIAFYVSAAHWLDAAKHPVDEQFDELLAAIRDWQKAESGGEGGVAPPPVPSPSSQTAPPPLPPLVTGPTSPKQRSFPWWLFLLAAAVLVLVAAVIFFAVTSKGPYERAGTVTLPTPSPTETPALPTPSPTATPAEPSPTATPTPAETPSPSVPATATPIRHKPGERLRPLASPTTEVPAMPPPAETPPQTAASAAPPKPIVQEVAASSQLGKEFRPNLAFDGKLNTGWVPKGAGTEQSLFVHFKTPALVKTVSILNGSGRDEEHYRAANRVKTLRIVLSDGTNQLLTFKDEMRLQRFDLERPVTASWAKFEIVSIVSGSKTNHAGIAEIVFNEP